MPSVTSQLIAVGGSARPPDTSLVKVTAFSDRAIGDGVTDATDAFVAAAAEGIDLYVPPTDDFYAVDVAVALAQSNQQVVGGGRASHIKQMTSGQNIFTVGSSFTDCGFAGLHLDCADGASLQAANGILSQADRTAVLGCVIRNHRMPGVQLQGASDCLVRGNIFLDSRVLASDNHSQAGYDIYLTGSARRNLVMGNHCVSGQGVGIGVQTISAPDDASYNTIIGNVIRNAKQYGLMVYRNLSTTLLGSLLLGNIIDTVTGEVEHQSSGDVYGAGIYIQGCDHTICAENQIANTHSTNAATVADTLTPGAIGVTNCSAVQIVGNRIRNAGRDGIHVSLGTALAESLGHTVVEGNHVYDYGRDAIRVVRRGDISIDDNVLVNLTKTASGRGILIFDGGDVTHRSDIKVRRNTVRRSVSNGIELAYVSRARVEQNHVDKAVVHGIVVGNTQDSVIEGNDVVNAKVRNYQVVNTSSGVQFRRNRSYGASTGVNWADGTAASATTDVWNIAGTNVNTEDNWSDGTGNQTVTAPTAAAQDATPSVKGLSTLVTANASATTITALDDMAEGQTVTIVANDANTTFDFSGSSLKGNDGVDYAAASGDAVIATKRNGIVFCTIVKA